MSSSGPCAMEDEESTAESEADLRPNPNLLSHPILGAAKRLEGRGMGAQGELKGLSVGSLVIEFCPSLCEVLLYSICHWQFGAFMRWVTKR